MKIIEPGKVEEKWTIRHRCTAWGNGGKGCEALLEVDYEDLRFYHGSGQQDRTFRDPAVCFKCPCCGRLTDIGVNDWPIGYKELERWTTEWQEEQPATKSAAA